MLTPLNLIAVVVAWSTPLLVLGGLLALAGWAERRRLWVINRQVSLTDAIHRELGAVVAPVVEKRAWGPWRAVMAVPPSGLAMTARLTAIALDVLGATGNGGPRVEVVFTRRDEQPHPPARSASTRRVSLGGGHRLIGGALDGPLRDLPQDEVARAKPALERR